MRAPHATRHGMCDHGAINEPPRNEAQTGTAPSHRRATARVPQHDSRPGFDYSRSNFSDWNRGDPVASHFFNALSLFFPAGEKFFIHSVKCFSARVTDPVTAAAVRTFVSQEASHSNEHRRYLEAMVRQGYKIDALDIRMFARPLASVSPAWRLAMTVAMEHFTASLSRSLLEAGCVDGDTSLTRLWHWHACEELEHQSVALDVYRQTVGTGARAYWLRVAAAVRVSWNFLPRLTANFAALLAHDLRLPRVVCYLKALSYLWGRPGVFSVLAPDFIAYFRPSFHPGTRWGSDQALIAAVRSELEIAHAA
ncbi:Predicted metal-dependent hydrolase [Burkholderia stabilis]|uniref:Predicted metal-dependent hydrolase n=2 Tax=Burkholderia stabilis TaxID=95485 RepID=A0AAJ5T878_9BURK|nr:Predicted metal-dependent hydrolase [Burkholderia stabilis]